MYNSLITLQLLARWYHEGYFPDSFSCAGAAAKPPPGAAKRPVLSGRGRGRGVGARPMKLGAQKLKPKTPDEIAKDYL